MNRSRNIATDADLKITNLNLVGYRIYGSGINIVSVVRLVAEVLGIFTWVSCLDFLLKKFAISFFF